MFILSFIVCLFVLIIYVYTFCRFAALSKQRYFILICLVYQHEINVKVLLKFYF